MIRYGLVASTILLAGSGIAFAQSGGPDAPPPKGPEGPGKHRHMPPPPPPALQGKGFILNMGHGRSLQVQCGDEPMQGCLKAVQPLIGQLRTAGGPPGAMGPGGPGPQPGAGPSKPQPPQQPPQPQSAPQNNGGSADQGDTGDSSDSGNS